MRVAEPGLSGRLQPEKIRYHTGPSTAISASDNLVIDLRSRLQRLNVDRARGLCRPPAPRTDEQEDQERQATDSVADP